MKKLSVSTHDGNEYTVDVNSYDPIAINDQINNNELNTIIIGDLIISRINVKTIIPVVVNS